MLAHPFHLAKALPDSLDITHYVAGRYPNLIPEGQKTQIVDLLKELHSVNYFSLSFQKQPAYGKGLKSAVVERLSQPGISEKYRTALEYKLTV